MGKAKKPPFVYWNQEEIFGEVEALRGQPHETLVQALESVLVCEIKREDFEHFLKRCPTVSVHLLKSVGGRLQKVESKFSDLVFHSASARLAKLLLELGESMGERDQRHDPPQRPLDSPKLSESNWDLSRNSQRLTWSISTTRHAQSRTSPNLSRGHQ